MPKKIEVSANYTKSATDKIKASISLRQLYVAIHGAQPGRLEMQRFSNRLNPARSNPGADMLGLCIQHTPSLHQMTLKEFFGIKENASALEVNSNPEKP